MNLERITCQVELGLITFFLKETWKGELDPGTFMTRFNSSGTMLSEFVKYLDQDLEKAFGYAPPSAIPSVELGPDGILIRFRIQYLDMLRKDVERVREITNRLIVEHNRILDNVEAELLGKPGDLDGSSN